MPHLRIALKIESLRLPLRQALPKAAELGVDGVQFNAVGDLAPSNLSATGCRAIRRLLADSGLELTALGFPTRHGYNCADGLEARIAAAQKVMSLSFQLGAPIVIGTIGRVPEDRQHPARELLTAAMSEIGRHGNRVGAVFAAETGTESGATLRGLLDELASVSVRANMDPANLLIKGYDPIQAVRDLGETIVHTHVHDAMREAASDFGIEVPAGDGDLDWEEFLGALEEVGYHGWLTIELEQTPNPLAGVARSVSFLRQF